MAGLAFAVLRSVCTVGAPYGFFGNHRLRLHFHAHLNDCRHLAQANSYMDFVRSCHGLNLVALRHVSYLESDLGKCVVATKKNNLRIYMRFTCC